MEFTSLHFVLFMLGLLLLIHAGRLNHGMRKGLLLLASYYFYACWDWRFTGLLALSTLLSYWIGAHIGAARSERARRLYLGVAVAALLGILFYFKYANFFIENLKSLAANIGWQLDISLLQIILPVGISFFTFQCISYVVDVYRGHTPVCRKPFDFALYIAFFPTLLSGPITRSRELLPQLDAAQPPHEGAAAEGLALMARGFIKKLFFADIISAQLVTPAFADPSGHSTLFLVVAVYAYSYQIYMDLSGYTDIARGIAATFGYKLPINFNRPYLAPTVSNFWQRWHMSMSGFFRDYLYFSLGGSKHGSAYVNLFITFVFIGFWHGASWGFLVYGAIHGLCVCWERWRRGRAERLGLAPASPWRVVLGIVIAFHIIAFSRVLFRAADLGAAIAYFGAMVDGAGGASPWRWPGLVLLALAVLLHYTPARWSEAAVRRFAPLPPLAQAATLAVLTFVLGAFASQGAPFVYFQF